jgi:cytosine/adenosine deaminase-related metal-dependent hydrolase
MGGTMVAAAIPGLLAGYGVSGLVNARAATDRATLNAAYEAQSNSILATIIATLDRTIASAMDTAGCDIALTPVIQARVEAPADADTDAENEATEAEAARAHRQARQ